MVVNPAYTLEEDLLALRDALAITDDELDLQMEIGELLKRIVLLMIPEGKRVGAVICTFYIKLDDVQCP